MTMDELADKLREALRNAQRDDKQLSLVLFGMAYVEELDDLAERRQLAEFYRAVNKYGTVVNSTNVEVGYGRNLVRKGYATLDEDTLWF